MPLSSQSDIPGPACLSPVFCRWPLRPSALPPGRGSVKFLHQLMTRGQIQTAINEGIRFDIKMADEATYCVRQQYQVAVGRTSVVVFDDMDLARCMA
jgi:hypothetical protein